MTYCPNNASKESSYLFCLFLSAGGSIGGIGVGVRRDGLIGGTMVDAGRTETDGLPADVDRIAGVCSTKFRPK